MAKPRRCRHKLFHQTTPKRKNRSKCDRASLFSLQVAIRAAVLGNVFGLGLILSFSGWTCSHFGWYMAALSFFHWSEFMATAITNPRSLSLESYLLDHSKEYHMAAVASWVEFFMEWYFFPGKAPLVTLTASFNRKQFAAHKCWCHLKNGKVKNWNQVSLRPSGDKNQRKVSFCAFCQNQGMWQIHILYARLLGCDWLTQTFCTKLCRNVWSPSGQLLAVLFWVLRFGLWNEDEES